jgi:Pyridoxamine 5'-phosphate oxidase
MRTARRCSVITAKSDGPSLSVVYYVMDGDDLLMSTMWERGKAKAVRRNPKVSLY